MEQNKYVLLVRSHSETFCHYQPLNGVVLQSRCGKGYLIGVYFQFGIELRHRILEELFPRETCQISINEHHFQSLDVHLFQNHFFRGGTCTGHPRI